MKLIFRYLSVALLAAALWGCGQGGGQDDPVSGEPSVEPSSEPSSEPSVEPSSQDPELSDDTSSDRNRPQLKGLLVYHTYTSYDAMDSKLFLYDFAQDRLREISRKWTTVSNAMNGHISPDGKFVTFMGIGSATGSWDIFLYDIEAGSEPRNLTAIGGFRDEDPKFSFDGKKIVFKRDDALMEVTVADGALKSITNRSGFHMPFYSVDGSKILYGGGSGEDSFIGCWDVASASAKVLYDKKRTVEYYPITIDSDSFYYTQNYSADDHHDQVYKGFFDARESIYLAFNNKGAEYADGYPVGQGWLIISSTRFDSRGQYDLYIAHETTGAIYSLSTYNQSINTRTSELGSCYRAR